MSHGRWRKIKSCSRRLLKIYQRCLGWHCCSTERFQVVTKCSVSSMSQGMTLLPSSRIFRVFKCSFSAQSTHRAVQGIKVLYSNYTGADAFCQTGLRVLQWGTETVPRGEPGNPGDPSGGPGRRRHDRRGARGGARAGRPTSAGRLRAGRNPK